MSAWEWKDSTDASGAPIREARVGHFVLVVEEIDDARWSAAVHVVGITVLDDRSVEHHLDEVCAAFGYTTCEDAQRAAEEMAARLVAPFVEAERAAIRAEVERRSSAESEAGREPSTRGFVASFAARALDSLREWLDARSKAVIEAA